MSESEKNTDAAQVRDDGLNSIIEQLGLSGRVVPVHLLPEEHDPDSNTKHFAERIPGSRYNYLSEIGRGGFGLVYKARDKDLGRDVAIKTLKDESSSREQVVERFIEEAQIGAQLQHPGIVPVYEMGVDGKKRPFFAMKLIKGRTLRALLEERKDSAQELGKFLGIFQVVCQTMA